MFQVAESFDVKYFGMLSEETSVSCLDEGTSSLRCGDSIGGTKRCQSTVKITVSLTAC
jgi:hypothetical protein